MTSDERFGTLSGILKYPSTLGWYPLWKYLNQWPEDTSKQAAVDKARAYFRERGTRLRLARAVDAGERRERLESLLQACESEAWSQHYDWLPDLLAAFLFYDDFTRPRANASVTAPPRLRERLRNALQGHASAALLAVAERCLAARQWQYSSDHDPLLAHYNDDIWMLPFLEFPELDRDAFGQACLIWTPTDAARFCVHHTSLPFVPICRAILTETEQGTALCLDHMRLPELPAGIGALHELRSLALQDAALKSLPAEFAELSTLEELRLELCGFSEVPSAVFELCKLRRLYINGGTALKQREFPAALGQLSELRALFIQAGCIRSLPMEIGYLTQLERLHIQCFAFEILPESVINLENLEELALINCFHLARLPDTLFYLTGLKKLTISYWPYAHVPSALLKMPFLETLRLTCNKRLADGEADLLKEALPDSDVAIAYYATPEAKVA